MRKEAVTHAQVHSPAAVRRLPKKPKPELIRVVRAPDGDISLDARGKAAGRGAYLCPNPECLKKARKSRALERAFDAPIPAEIYEQLTAELEVLQHG